MTEIGYCNLELAFKENKIAHGKQYYAHYVSTAASQSGNATFAYLPTFTPSWIL